MKTARTELPWLQSPKRPPEFVTRRKAFDPSARELCIRSDKVHRRDRKETAGRNRPEGNLFGLIVRTCKALVDDLLGLHHTYRCQDRMIDVAVCGPSW